MCAFIYIFQLSAKYSCCRNLVNSPKEEGKPYRGHLACACHLEMDFINTW